MQHHVKGRCRASSQQTCALEQGATPRGGRRARRRGGTRRGDDAPRLRGCRCRGDVDLPPPVRQGGPARGTARLGRGRDRRPRPDRGGVRGPARLAADAASPVPRGTHGDAAPPLGTGPDRHPDHHPPERLRDLRGTPRHHDRGRVLLPARAPRAAQLRQHAVGLRPGDVQPRHQCKGGCRAG